MRAPSQRLVDIDFPSSFPMKILGVRIEIEFTNSDAALWLCHWKRKRNKRQRNLEVE